MEWLVKRDDTKDDMGPSKGGLQPGRSNYQCKTPLQSWSGQGGMGRCILKSTFFPVVSRSMHQATKNRSF